MKILITTQVYPPELHPTGVMVRELAIDLAREGPPGNRGDRISSSPIRAALSGL